MDPDTADRVVSALERIARVLERDEVRRTVKVLAKLVRERSDEPTGRAPINVVR